MHSNLVTRVSCLTIHRSKLKADATKDIAQTCVFLHSTFMHILVTGSSGTIGTRLCETLTKQGHTFAGFDIVPNNWQPSVQEHTTQIDIRDKDALLKLDEKADAIVHLAANARVYELVEDPQRAMDNMTTVFNTLEYARAKGIKRIIFASSRECYGNVKLDKYVEEAAHIDNTASPYSASKLAGEALVKSYARCYGIDAIVVRFSNVYGMYDNSERVIPRFIRRAKANDTLPVYGKDKCLDFTYIDDTVQGIIQALEKFDDTKNETYNLAVGKGTTILQLAEVLKELLGSTSEIEIGETLTGEVTHYIADISKAKEKIGYDPKVSFDEGIRKTVEWYEAHPGN